VSLGRVSARFLVGVGAWLLGAGAATGGSLLAVSVLGQGLAPAPSQQLTVAAVNRALAIEAAEAAQSPSPPQPPVSTSATPLAPHPKKSSAAPAVPPPSPAPQPTTTVLTSAGGTVIAGCQPAGAYLYSWSPAQTYEERSVVRGPGATTKVTFTSSRKQVVMVISCTSGVPAASTKVTNWGGDE
jgi:hypothetical protein